MKESSQLLYQICVANPFTHAVEMIRFALYGQFNVGSALYVAAVLAEGIRRRRILILGCAAPCHQSRKTPPTGTP